MKKVIVVCTFLMAATLSMQAQQVFQNFRERVHGNPDPKGTFRFDRNEQAFIIEGIERTDAQGDNERFYVARKVEGDFIFSANVEFYGKPAAQTGVVGLMIRSQEEDEGVFMNGLITREGDRAFQYSDGSEDVKKVYPGTLEDHSFIQVERSGNEFILRYSTAGQPLEEAGRVTLEMDKVALAGMFVSSDDSQKPGRGRFWNVRLEKPAPTGTDGYQKPSPSRLEILNIESGNRELIYETEAHIEAPNWSRNGRFLIYNSEGKLYKFDLRGRKPQVIDTGFATSNNNDHGISFDGKRLAISHHTEEDGRRHSIIYTVPLKGGTPVRVTAKGPSYWHGWSPDDKWHVYCAERNGNYDVYKISDQGGEEIRLTNAEGLDDGPEFSPDGNFIYFNSVRSGSMEIWRMKPDGTDQQQLTNDRFQNWFAHPSPDGKWLIFISYLPEVPAGSHPPNQRVMLRLMPASGGEIKTLAFLYGGQGTINVPSWSPDSKKVAFVSYTY